MNTLSDFKKQLTNHKGQGQVEYTLIVLLVALAFWLGVRDTNIGENLQTSWTEVAGSFIPAGGGSGTGQGEGSGSSRS